MTQKMHPVRTHALITFLAPATRKAPPGFAAALMMCGAAACSGEPESSPRGELPVGHDVTMHVAEVEGQRLEFVSLAPDAESRPIHTIISTLRRGQHELVAALFEHYGPLTMLEVFNAVAPLETPPAEIAQSHAAEARALGRETEDVRAVDLDWIDGPRSLGEAGPIEQVDKSLPPGAVDECREILFENTAQVTWSRIIINAHSSPGPELSFPGYMCVAGRQDRFVEPGANICSQSFVTNPRSRVGICHFDPDSETTAIQVGGSLQGQDMTYSSPRLVLYQDIIFSTFFPDGVPQRNAIVNFPPSGAYSYILGTAVGDSP
jgi:hypothetical protein